MASTVVGFTTRIRLEKVATDNGFDLSLPAEEGWLGFASTQAPLRLWLSATPDGLFHAALSQLHVARAIQTHSTSLPLPLPAGAWALLTVADIPTLHRLVRRAFQLSRSLPDELLQVFEKKTASLPRTTEVERLAIQRVGQDLFRDGLFEYWDGRCAISGLEVPELLRASHIKPWAHCSSDAERLDVWNGLLLAPHFDLAFDLGFLTVEDDGTVVVSPALTPEDRKHLGFDVPLRVRSLADGHRAYLPWHRARVYRRSRG